MRCARTSLTRARPTPAPITVRDRALALTRAIADSARPARRAAASAVGLVENVAMPASSHGDAERLDPVMVEALKQLRSFTYRRRRLQSTAPYLEWPPSATACELLQLGRPAGRRSRFPVGQDPDHGLARAARQVGGPSHSWAGCHLGSHPSAHRRAREESQRSGGALWRYPHFQAPQAPMVTPGTLKTFVPGPSSMASRPRTRSGLPSMPRACRQERGIHTTRSLRPARDRLLARRRRRELLLS
jgi:hypothetical protein